MRTPTVACRGGNNPNLAKSGFADELATREGGGAGQRTAQAARSQRMTGRRVVHQTAAVLLSFAGGTFSWMLVCWPFYQ